MADEENILGGRLSIEDNYSSALMKFANSVLGTENKFKQFADKVIGSNNKIGNSMTKTEAQVNKFAQKFIQQGNSVSDAINKANEKVKEKQEQTIEGLTKKYLKLGMTIQDAYGKAQTQSNNIWGNGSTPTGNGGSGEGLKGFAETILNGGFTGMLGKLGLIGAGVTAGIAVLKSINSVMETGFTMLNNVSDNMFSYEGLKNAMMEATGFQTGREKLNLFYGSDEAGLKQYKVATSVARKTFASEQDTIDIMAKMGQLGIKIDDNQLERLLDVAGTRPEVGTEHIGLAVKEAVEGRVNMLQMYGINNKNLYDYYESLKKTDKTEYKRLKGAIDKKHKVGDQQKYVDLITSYIEQSPMNGYAETYAKTVQGKMERLEGVWQQIKAGIMGIDIDTGTAKVGGAFESFGNMVDKLKDTLEDTNTAKAFDTISKGLGDGFKQLGDAFNFILDNTDWQEVAKSITESIKIISDSLIQLKESGALDELVENFPQIVKALVGSKATNMKNDLNTATYWATGHPVKAASSWAGGLVDKFIWNNLQLKDYQGNSVNNEWIKTNPYYEQSLADSWKNKIIHPGEITDRDIFEMVRKSNLSDEQKQSLQGLINGDDKGSYNIHIEKIEANNFDEIMAAIKQAAANKR